MYNLDERIKKIKGTLSEISTKMIGELERIAEFENHPETELLEFEIHDLDSIVLYPMTREGNQVGGDISSGYFINCYRIPIKMRQVLCDFIDELERNFEADYYNEIIKILIEWFSDCWDEVKSRVSLPTYITLHDSNILYDLSNKRWGKMWEQYR